MWLRFLLLGATVSLLSAKNRLLENYANKLNSISDRHEWRRIPERHRLKRYRCIEEYVDERGNVVEEGEEHVTTKSPIRIEVRRTSGKSGRANEGVHSSSETILKIASTTEMSEKHINGNNEIVNHKLGNSEIRSATEKSESLENSAVIASQISATHTAASSGLMRKESSSETESEQQQRDDEFEEISLPKNTVREVIRYTLHNADNFDNYEDDFYFVEYKPYTRRRLGRKSNSKHRDISGRRVPRRRLDRRLSRVIIPRYFETLTAQHQDVARASASSQNRSNPKERLHAISITLPHRETPPAAVPLSPPPTVVMPSATSKLPNIQKATQYEDATTETCARIHRLASAFGISDVSNYARQNCRLLQLFASGFTCEQIIYFVNSCHKSLSYQQEKAK